MTVETEPHTQTDRELADEAIVRSLLARANLFRMRAQWNEAVTACTEALRYAPRSATAHSLLGDIYEAQGRQDDAAQWFAMAVELDPANGLDRAKYERLTELQRIRLRTQDIAAAAARPQDAGREKTLEWFDRLFPPGRSDSLARLILVMSLGFALLIAACAAFIYVYISPHRLPAVATDAESLPAATLALPAPPVVMTPTSLTPDASSTAASPTSGSAAPLLKSVRTDKSAAPPTDHNVAAMTNAAIAAALRTRLTPLLNGPEMQIANLAPGENGSVNLDLLLATGSATETTDHLRERALRAAGSAAHALNSAASGETTRVSVRVARLLPAVAIASSVGNAAPAKSYELVFSGDALLREFRDGDPATMTPSDLMARFQNPQWLSSGNAPSGASTAAPAATAATAGGSAGESGGSGVSATPAPGAGTL